MYGSQQTSYPTQQPPYPTQQPPYPTQQPPYPTQQPPYPTQQPPYPTQQPPYCVPPSYDEAVGGKSYQVPSQLLSQAPYQAFPPEHTITVCSLHQNSLQPCDCCPHNPPPQQYPIVIQQDVITRTQNTHQCVRIFFIILVLIFFCIFFGVLIRIVANINRHFD